MEELIKNVTSQAKISPEQARAAVDAVLTFLKDKVPAPLYDQIKAALSGQQIDANTVTNALGGLFGGQPK